jgi:hypothetical protein
MSEGAEATLRGLRRQMEALRERGEWPVSKVVAERDHLLAENERLREALRYYAAESSYEQTGWNDDTFPVVHEDGGRRARAALDAGDTGAAPEGGDGG